MKYTATVRDVEEGTYVDSNSFVYGMCESIGKTLEFDKLPDYYGDGNWYEDVNDKYYYHASWLKDIKPTGENEMQIKYLVVSVRKSDGMVFFPDGAQCKGGIDDFESALGVAKNKAKNNSDAYIYVVYKCVPVASVELDNPPTKVTYYSD